MDLTRKAIETGRCESITEAQAKAQKLLDESMEAVRENAKALAEANMRVFQTWANLVQSGAKSAAEAAPAAQKQA